MKDIQQPELPLVSPEVLNHTFGAPLYTARQMHAHAAAHGEVCEDQKAALKYFKMQALQDAENRVRGFNNEGDPIGGDCGGKQEPSMIGQACANLGRGKS